ncbi:MAG: AI-2E family transporter [Muribaculaceae bacterium]|nr:AI-2E family transporter [Muribaculaceae bacterium]
MPKLPSAQYWTTDRIMQLIIVLACGGVFIWLVGYLSDVLLPFVAACFIAYLMEPLVAWNLRITRARKRVVGVVLSLVEVLAVFVLAGYLFIPSVVKEIDMLGDIIRDLSSGKRELPPAYTFVVDFATRYFDARNLRDLISGSHFAAILSQGSSLLEESLETVLHILAWLLTFIYIIFILIDYQQIVRGFKLIFPRKYRAQGWTIVRDVQRSMNSYFRGQGLVALIAAVLYSAGFSIVGLPLAIPMGVLVGILYMIPYFQYVTLIPVAAICLIYSLGGHVEFLPELGKCALVYLITQSLCDYVITPHVMGKEMGLNPAMILLSLSVWGSLLGIIGMIIALPATALIMTYYEKYISNPTPRKKAPAQVPATADVPDNSEQ